MRSSKLFQHDIKVLWIFDDTKKNGNGKVPHVTILEIYEKNHKDCRLGHITW
jgi:hypothetical protein